MPPGLTYVIVAAVGALALDAQPTFPEPQKKNVADATPGTPRVRTNAMAMR